jgi:hypothetical protein
LPKLWPQLTSSTLTISLLNGVVDYPLMPLMPRYPHITDLNLEHSNVDWELVPTLSEIHGVYPNLTSLSVPFNPVNLLADESNDPLPFITTLQTELGRNGKSEERGLWRQMAL